MVYMHILDVITIVAMCNPAKYVAVMQNIFTCFLRLLNMYMYMLQLVIL